MRLNLFIIAYLFAQNVAAENFHDLTYRLKASVVKVHVATKSGGHGVGTGVVVAKDLVATNCHIIANAIGVKITKFGDSFSPEAIKADWEHDLCLLRFQYLELSPVTLGDSENLKYQQSIFSIGFPGGPPKPQSTQGKIKALYALDGSQVVRTNASFVMGASGSPVFDENGKLIAISTFKSPGHGAYFYNLPVKWVKALIEAPESTSLKSDITPFWDMPEEKRPFFMRVVLPYQNKRWDDLKLITDQWVKHEPTSAEALFYAGVAYVNLGDLKQANQYFARVLELNPHHSATLIELGLLANKIGMSEEVEKTRLALQEIDPDLNEEFTEALKLSKTGCDLVVATSAC
jgi:serine protease Do